MEKNALLEGKGGEVLVLGGVVADTNNKWLKELLKRDEFETAAKRSLNFNKRNKRKKAALRPRRRCRLAAGGAAQLVLLRARGEGGLRCAARTGGGEASAARGRRLCRRAYVQKKSLHLRSLQQSLVVMHGKYFVMHVRGASLSTPSIAAAIFLSSAAAAAP